MATVAVTGAGGKTGRAVVAALAPTWDVVALVRTPDHANRVELAGATTLVGDMTDRVVLDRLCAGADVVYHICPNFSADEVEIGRRVADAAERVEGFVYHSVLHPQTEDMPHHWRKLRVEELLLRRRPGAVTFLRPAPYVQNLVPYLDAACREGELRLPYSVDTPTAMVDLDDVGRAAAAVLDGRVDPGSGWDLAGVASVSHREIASLLSSLVGRSIDAIAVDPGPVPDDLGRMFAYMDRHGLPASTGQLAALVGEPTPLDVTLRRLLDHHVAVSP